MSQQKLGTSVPFSGSCCSRFCQHLAALLLFLQSLCSKKQCISLVAWIWTSPPAHNNNSLPHNIPLLKPVVIVQTHWQVKVASKHNLKTDCSDNVDAEMITAINTLWCIYSTKWKLQKFVPLSTNLERISWCRWDTQMLHCFTSLLFSRICLLLTLRIRPLGVLNFLIMPAHSSRTIDARHFIFFEWGRDEPEEYSSSCQDKTTNCP